MSPQDSPATDIGNMLGLTSLATEVSQIANTGALARASVQIHVL